MTDASRALREELERLRLENGDLKDRLQGQLWFESALDATNNTVVITDPTQPDNAPELLEHLTAIEACHSIAGNASYILFVRVSTPRALEALIRDIRLSASVSTRTTVVLQTFYENRPIALGV